LWINDQDVNAPEDDAFDLAVASGDVVDVEHIAAALRGWSRPRVPPQRTQQ
jgi:hypothetical protein